LIFGKNKGKSIVGREMLCSGSLCVQIPYVKVVADAVEPVGLKSGVGLPHFTKFQAGVVA
jgi:hypothetical protein